MTAMERTQPARPSRKPETWRMGKQQEPSTRRKYTCTSREMMACQSARSLNAAMTCLRTRFICVRSVS